jgi:hypothetical protein
MLTLNNVTFLFQTSQSENVTPIMSSVTKNNNNNNNNSSSSNHKVIELIDLDDDDVIASVPETQPTKTWSPIPNWHLVKQVPRPSISSSKTSTTTTAASSLTPTPSSSVSNQIAVTPANGVKQFVFLSPPMPGQLSRLAFGNGVGARTIIRGPQV